MKVERREITYHNLMTTFSNLLCTLCFMKMLEKVFALKIRNLYTFSNYYGKVTKRKNNVSHQLNSMNSEKLKNSKSEFVSFFRT